VTKKAASLATCVVKNLLLPAILMSTAINAATDPLASGTEYTVKNGDWLAKLARVHLGNSLAYSQIVVATNAKAAQDSRFATINDIHSLSPGQLIWLPTANSVTETAVAGVVSLLQKEPTISSVASSVASSVIPPDVNEEPLAVELVEVAAVVVQQPTAVVKTMKVSIPQSNCQIQTWYDYQIVAIPKVNERWIVQGVRLEERAIQAFKLRNDARLNARFMIADKDAVAKHRLQDKLEYGNPNGPTFSYQITQAQSSGFKGNAIYQSIIDNAGKLTALFDEQCH
jgi:hypothetical protein